MNTIYFDSMIDDFGIWQHADGHKPYPEHGYALDDVARGLVACLAMGKTGKANVLFDYLKKARKGSDFSGFAHANREFFAYPSSEDAKAQVIWAYGYAISKSFRAEEAKAEIAAFQSSIANMTSLRGPAYALLGAIYFDKAWAGSLAAKLAEKFKGLGDDWLWPESPMTYALGIIPYCLLRYEIVTGDTHFHDLAMRILIFVEHISTYNRPLGPVGNIGWYSKGQKAAPNYSQQPIDAGYMVWAHMAAFQLTHDDEYLYRAERWMAWFDGDNIAHTPMWNPDDNRCADGIDETGVSTDSGAETNICYLLSRWVIENKDTI